MIHNSIYPYKNLFFNLKIIKKKLYNLNKNIINHIILQLLYPELYKIIKYKHFHLFKLYLESDGNINYIFINTSINNYINPSLFMMCLLNKFTKGIIEICTNNKYKQKLSITKLNKPILTNPIIYCCLYSSLEIIKNIFDNIEINFNIILLNSNINIATYIYNYLINLNITTNNIQQIHNKLRLEYILSKITPHIQN
tara:strand:- start:150 stop:740 length:591 start_codon:yes stop_codon:yes gene_type:complete